ncbi:MAG: AAA family ATPase, partial [Myxococcota bacterium]
EVVHATGQGRLVIVRGDAGIGKSVITTSISRALIHRDPDTLCIYHPYLDPRWSLRQGDIWAMAGTLLGTETPDPTSLSRSLQEAIARGFEGREEIFKTLQAFQEQRINPLLSSVEVLRSKRHELFNALSQPFLEPARQHMLLWFLEDLHREDSITLAFLQHLLGLFEHTPVQLLIIATVDEEALMPSTRKARALVPLLTTPSKSVHVMTLRGVDEDAALSHMASVLDRPLAPELALALHRLTDGHPQFADEAIKHLAENDRLVLQGNGQYTLVHDQELDELLPHRLPDLIQQRIQHHRYRAQSGALLRYTLEAVALLGSEASDDTVRTFMTSLDETLNPETLNLALQEAIQLGYIESPHGHLRFCLLQTQRMLLDQIDRTATHDGDSGDFARNRLGMAALFLLERHPEPTPMVLHHIVSLFVMAGRRDKAARCLRKAAHSAYYRFDLDTAIDTYLQALRYARRPSIDSGQLAFVDPETDEELTVFLRLGECYAILGDMGLAQDYLTCALRGAQLVSKQNQGTSIRGQAMQLKGDLALLQGNIEAAAWHFIQARRAFEKVGQDQGIARSVIERARIHLLEGQPQEALDPLLEALVLAEYIEVIPIQIQALAALARTHLQLGDPRRAMKDVRQALDLHQRENDASNIANILIDLGEIQYVTGDLEQARYAVQQAITSKMRMGERFGLTRARLLIGRIHAAMGRLNEARHELEQGIELCVRHHDPIGAAQTRLMLTDLDVHHNRLEGIPLDRVEGSYRTILQDLLEMEATELVGAVLNRLAMLKANQEQFPQAQALLREATSDLGGAKENHQRLFKAMLAWLSGLEGDRASSHSHLDELIATSQAERAIELLFVSCMLMSDLYMRCGEPENSHTIIQLAYSQVLLSGRLTEAAQCRLELQRCGAYGEAAATAIGRKALLLGPIATLPLLL